MREQSVHSQHNPHIEEFYYPESHNYKFKCPLLNEEDSIINDADNWKYVYTLPGTEPLVQHQMLQEMEEVDENLN